MPLQIAPFLQAVVVNKGSDLHIKAGSPPKIRISGTLVPVARGILSDKLAARRPASPSRIGRLLIDG